MPVSERRRPFPVEEHRLRVGVPKYPAIAYTLQLSKGLECAQLLVVRHFPLYHFLLASHSSRSSLLPVLFPSLALGRYCMSMLLLAPPYGL